MNEAVQRFFYPVVNAPHEEAVYDCSTGMRYTYGDVGMRARKLSRFLVDDCGLCPGDIVAFISENRMPFIDAFYCTCLTGITLTAYNHKQRAEDLAPLIHREAPRVMFVAARHLRLAQESCGLAEVSPRFVVIDGPSSQGITSYDEIMQIGIQRLSRCEALFDFSLESIQMLVHTGGTTGLPKSAMESFRAVFYNAAAGVLSTNTSSRDVSIIFLPFFHAAGWLSAALPILFAGGRIVLPESLEPSGLLRLISEERPTVGTAVEAIFRSLAAHPLFQETDFSSYTRLTNGGGAISEATMKIYWDRGVRLVSGYGMTETGPNNCYPLVSDMSFDQIRERWNAVGKPMYFSELKVVDERGEEVPVGVNGELYWRGPAAFSGYFGNPGATEQVMTDDGWVKSGDAGHVDEDGCLFICGRKKNMFISYGENIFPPEVENALLACPSVAECYVIGVPDEQRGEVGKAIVVMRDGCKFNRDELFAYAKGRLPSIKVPKYFAEAKRIPRIGMKASLPGLREMYGAPRDGA